MGNCTKCRKIYSNMFRVSNSGNDEYDIRFCSQKLKTINLNHAFLIVHKILRRMLANESKRIEIKSDCSNSDIYSNYEGREIP